MLVQYGSLGPPARPVPLCAPCWTGRPGRGSADLANADMAWRSLVEQCAAVTDDYEAGRWLPSLCELEVAEGLARTAWSETTMTTARDAVASVPTGLTVGLFANAASILRVVDAADTALRPLRVLVDIIADDAPSILQVLRPAAD
ncbi:hypothetical protein [Streptomyces sp. NPDC056527]|uniref:hypothetical protein n=1 Tax=Streptomyces sp. NPDC056527 TaxID=3345853 RepID=UPI0036861F66